MLYLSPGVYNKDPSYTLMVPVQQYRSDYSFMIPADYNSNYITITAPDDIKSVIVYKSDDTVFKSLVNSDFSRISGTGYSYYRLNMGTAQTAYKLVADKPVGVQSYGYYNRTSYSYPLGLNLLKLNLSN